jgi:hypothetical protein
MAESETQVLPSISFKDFLENVPPGKVSNVENLGNLYTPSSGGGLVPLPPPSFATYRLNPPDLELHCERCKGIRLFTLVDDRGLFIQSGELNLRFILYTCRNCGRSTKAYALYIEWLSEDTPPTQIEKIGETPPFGPPTPARVVSLIGPEKDHYFKGRRSENQGLGIAAFAYYRRVVENQTNRIFASIIRVAERVGASKQIIEELTAAQKETQFTKAVESIKTGIPQVLLVNGHNPLTLLHSALSEGLHAQTDEQCLELATSIRIVLTELAERLASALKDDAELQTAVSRLLTKKPLSK